jgi:O-antigen/teichoic acid export membrane protein
VGNLANLATFRVDALILANTRNPVELGLYAGAANVAEVVLYLPTSVAAVLLSAGASMSPSDSRVLTLRALRLVVASSLALGACGIIFASPIVSLLLGAEFSDSVTPLRILLIGISGVALHQILSAGFAALGKQVLSSVLSVITLILVLLLDLALIPELGPTGAALASMIAYLVGGVLSLLTFLRGQPRSSREQFPSLWVDITRALVIGRDMVRSTRGNSEPDSGSLRDEPNR